MTSSTKKKTAIIASTLFILIIVGGPIQLAVADPNAYATVDGHWHGLRTAGKDPELDPEIVGGNAAPANAYPYHIYWRLGCGGSLFHEDLILTAAHCKYDDNVLVDWPVYVGGDGSKSSGTKLLADRAYVYPLYSPNEVQAYDFMVLRLPQTFPDVPKVTINTRRNYPFNNQTLTVMGYGLLGEDDPISAAPDDLQQAQVQYIQQCAPDYYSRGRINDDIVFCAGHPDVGGRDACQGDSGSPIVDSQGVQVGLVSWGIGCARPNRPGVYARVSTVASWLEFLKCDASKVPPATCTQLTVQVTDQEPWTTGYEIVDEWQQGMVFQTPSSFRTSSGSSGGAATTTILTHHIPPGWYSFVFVGKGQIVVSNGSNTITLDRDSKNTNTRLYIVDGKLITSSKPRPPTGHFWP